MVNIVIGPSYSGKSYYCQELSVKSEGVVYVSHTTYRDYIGFEKKFFWITIFQLITSYYFFKIVSASLKVDLHLCIRVITYLFTSLVILNNYRSTSGFVFDEDFIKKIIDGAPRGKSMADYKNTIETYSNFLKKVIPYYIYIISKFSPKYVILDVPFAVASERSKARRARELSWGTTRSFRISYNMERRIYNNVANTLRAANIDVCIHS